MRSFSRGVLAPSKFPSSATRSISASIGNAVMCFLVSNVKSNIMKGVVLSVMPTSESLSEKVGQHVAYLLPNKRGESLSIQSITNRAERDGLAIAFVNPTYTSQICNQCGLLGDRNGSKFSCSSCSHNDCADRNASLNILSRFAVLRGGAHPSMFAEARASATGKLPALAGSSWLNLKWKTH